MENISAYFLTSLLLLLLAVVGLCVRMLLCKNGRFPNIHIGSNPNMKQRGIGCATSQDRQEQKENACKIDVKHL